MHRRTARGNRLGLALLGLLLILAGAALLGAHQGLYGAAGRNDPLYPAGAARFVHANHDWLWPGLAAVAILAGLVFLRWLVLQARQDRLRRLRIDTDQDTDQQTGAGRTNLPASALADLVEDDIAALPGVHRVSAAVSGQPDRPELWLQITTDTGADLADISTQLATRIIPDARQALDLESLPTYIDLGLRRHRTDRAST